MQVKREAVRHGGNSFNQGAVLIAMGVGPKGPAAVCLAQIDRAGVTV